MDLKVEIGDLIPDVSLPDQNGEKIRLRDFAGQAMVIFFYPKDETSICTKEVCSFRDSHAVFNSLNAVVFGISSDDVESHKKFHDQHQLNYSLLSDKDSALRKIFGATSFFGLISSRSTFIVDEMGKIFARYDSFLESQAHVDWAKNKLEELKK